jgi:plastocyanin
MALRIRRGTNAERQTIVFAEGELLYTTDTKNLYVGDGTTLGGILATGSGGGLGAVVEDLTPSLGGNLDLNDYEITGIGDIDITGTVTADIFSGGLFVGDGSGLTNIPGVDGIVEGSNYRINIIGDDSNIIVNTEDNSINANSINANSITVDSILLNNDSLSIRSLDDLNVNTQQFQILSKDNRSLLRLFRVSDADISNDNVSYGSILFEKDDINGLFTAGSISGTGENIFISAGGFNSFAESTFVSLDKDGNFGIGTFTPTVTLDVRGTAIISDVILANGGVILEPQDISLLDTNIGRIAYNQETDTLSLFNGSWVNLINTDEIGITKFPSAIILAATNTDTRNLFGNDSSLITGAVFYNTTEDKVQFFQAGSWVSLINNGSVMGQVLSWNGSEWAATDPVILEGTIENADALNGQSGAFYLDYNNFTNTPTIPANLTDLTDVTTAGLSANQIYLQSVTRLSVTNSGASAYLFDQYPGNNPTLRAVSGTTIAFDLNVTGHPFLIQDDTGTNFNTGLVHVANNGTVTTGSAAQGKETGTLYWKIPNNISGSYQYRCSIHGVMVGSIEIADSQFVGDKGLATRASLTGSTSSIANEATANVNITGYKGYMLYKIQTSAAAWVRLYVSDAARTADAARTQGQDPLPGSGVIAEVITTSAETVIIAPGVIGFNNESPVTNIVPAAVTNLSGGSVAITVTLTAVEMEV